MERIHPADEAMTDDLLAINGFVTEALQETARVFNDEALATEIALSAAVSEHGLPDITLVDRVSGLSPWAQPQILLRISELQAAAHQDEQGITRKPTLCKLARAMIGLPPL